MPGGRRPRLDLPPDPCRGSTRLPPSRHARLVPAVVLTACRRHPPPAPLEAVSG
ncbi:hypothetical protein ACFSM7_12110 [Clavibacter michiganensis subsp. tessellarius]|uniref:hypothetical protein n=1 Tax=Clavibacter tessellarius TaxID=31965 RepID=UPI0036373BA6